MAMSVSSSPMKEYVLFILRWADLKEYAQPYK